jgi:plasmid stabilization system protein ParE
MSRIIEKTALFHIDVTSQFRWYVEQADEKLGWHFFETVNRTILKLSRQPDIGNKRRFRDVTLHGLWSCRVEPPFGRLLIFYRFTETALQAWRLMHGARDLPQRLAEPPH